MCVSFYPQLTELKRVMMCCRNESPTFGIEPVSTYWFFLVFHEVVVLEAKNDTIAIREFRPRDFEVLD